jgi:hypothetical protein
LNTRSNLLVRWSPPYYCAARLSRSLRAQHASSVFPSSIPTPVARSSTFKSGNSLPSSRHWLASDGLAERSFTFPAGVSPNSPVLVGTQGFADLGLVKPDFIIPNGFLPLRNGSVRLNGLDWYGGPLTYTALPIDGVSSLYPNVDGDPYARAITDTAIAVNSAGQYYLFTPAAKVSGLWWTPSESGWGLAVEHQGDTVLALWATYDRDGSPTWFAMRAQHWRLLHPEQAMVSSPNTYLGTIFRSTGPAFGAIPFDPSAVKAVYTGNVIFNFYPNESAGGFIFENVGMSKAITSQTFAAPVPVCVEGAVPGPTLNFQGMWWNPSESGWGLHLTHQGDIVFAIWFTYDTNSKAIWLAMAASKTASNTYSGKIYRPTAGPPYDSGLFHSVPVVSSEVGIGTLTFRDRESGTFAYSVDSMQGVTNIARLVFASTATACN